MANQLSQTQCLTQAATLTPLSTFGPPLTGAFHQSLQSPTMAAACYYGSSQSLMPNQTAHMNYPSLNTTSPSTDSLFSVSTSLNSLPSECPPRRSDLDLKMETPDGDETDDFFDLEKHQKARSASFGGSTPYSTQLEIARHGLFAPSLDTIGSVASGIPTLVLQNTVRHLGTASGPQAPPTKAATFVISQCLILPFDSDVPWQAVS
ncbi:unnamed protein product [Haemonchus placei]|uniref:Uncharacterized protein n=1 Tax=Haemonchus placei TaxID=6290 RepID=A0A0N4WJQ9_HAEPC|nr:unnamed protein product [Haemonchus placei]